MRYRSRRGPGAGDSKQDREAAAAAIFRPTFVFSPDVLIVTVPYANGYPTQNHLFATDSMRGPKTVEYHALRDACKAAAEDAMEAGFAPLADDVDHVLRVTLYAPSNVHPDPGNCGKVEQDGFQDAGLIRNDRRFNPATFSATVDPLGSPRVVITVERRFEAAFPKRAPRRDTGARPAKASATQRIATEEPDVAGLTGAAALEALKKLGYKIR